ncbi:adenylyl-sulfate kinase [Janthinobacterium sp. 1_2014MBL_MicDiv]|uniref:adenylyl-sulfate kinase n=1 Tax=Janthinobacterium sp. 1_2014MBL_MicDiv TaxID=1644131 RepID=UPI0008F55182|nr:adenylyl-sulfate kinase [Janthinobacterium sp. 1_2014MBL_MicDiv]APA67853.1 adenylylsulfate kinase [Janthinobacterium sp. 1_2014MBL_MicDiv]
MRDYTGMAPATVWLTGLSGAGKTSIAHALAHRLQAEGRAVAVLDGDQLRHGLNRDLGFTPADRHENIRRTAEVARLMNMAGVHVIAAFISPYRADRAMAASIIGAGNFIEVHVSTPLDVCEARDAKGLYAKARAGQIAQFTGISAPYEAPLSAALTLDTQALALDESVERICRHLQRQS